MDIFSFKWLRSQQLLFPKYACFKCKIWQFSELYLQTIAFNCKKSSKKCYVLLFAVKESTKETSLVMICLSIGANVKALCQAIASAKYVLCICQQKGYQIFL